MMPIESLMTKKMSRKEFLLVVGAFLFSLSMFDRFVHTKVKNNNDGFGFGPYGGARKENY